MTAMPSRINSFTTLASALLTVVLVGCGKSTVPARFEPNLVHTMKYQIKEGVPMDQTSKDAYWIVNEMFGTPDDPKLPDFVEEDEDLAGLLSAENLQRAAGPEDAEGRGLYRKHCVKCHGVSGDGRGPIAFVQNPYPRDYRKGVFKFKSTPLGAKPTKADLTRLIANGISGTSMVKIKELTDKDVAALVDYVIYLSWRGETERAVVDDGVLNYDFASGERILDPASGERIRRLPAEQRTEVASTLVAINEEVYAEDLANYEKYLAFQKSVERDSELKTLVERAAGDDDEAEATAEELAEKYADYEAYADIKEDLEDDEELQAAFTRASEATNAQELTYFEQWGYHREAALGIGQSWLEADEETLEVPDPPEGLPVASSHRNYVELMKSGQADPLAASVKRGREIFTGKVANCSKCHGAKGLGDGQTNDYDEWTKDWTTRIDVKPDDQEALIPLLARGALPPINAIPRNFQEGIFRGGAESAQLYRRITQGIDGTPMPAATFMEGKFEREEVWHLINFIRSLQKQDAEAPAEASAVTPTTKSSGEE